MTRGQMIDRYTDLARQRSELFMRSATGAGWSLEQEREEKAILQEMAALETAIRLPVEEEQKIPTMKTLPQAAEETGLPYDLLRRLCLQGKIVHIRAGKKFLVNMEKLADYLNGKP